MGKKPIFAAVAAAMLVPTVIPATAFAQDGYQRMYRDDGYTYRDYRREQRDRYYNGDRTYRDSDGRYYYCKRSSGTTGTIAGGAGGAVLGNVLGGGTLGTIAGGVGGALLGRTLDKRHDAAQNRRNGC